MFTCPILLHNPERQVKIAWLPLDPHLQQQHLKSRMSGVGLPQLPGERVYPPHCTPGATFSHTQMMRTEHIEVEGKERRPLRGAEAVLLNFSHFFLQTSPGIFFSFLLAPEAGSRPVFPRAGRARRCGLSSTVSTDSCREIPAAH